jgi:hypothetical protein
MKLFVFSMVICTGIIAGPSRIQSQNSRLNSVTLEVKTLLATTSSSLHAEWRVDVLPLWIEKIAEKLFLMFPSGTGGEPTGTLIPDSKSSSSDSSIKDPSEDASINQGLTGETNKIGTLKYDDGRIYSGSLEGGKPHGYGQMDYPDDSYYKGTFKQGLRHGEGTHYQPDGSFIEANWLHDKVQQDCELKIRYPSLWVYMGPLNEDMRPDGHGRFIHPSMPCLSGDSKNGQMVGYWKYDDKTPVNVDRLKEFISRLLVAPTESLEGSICSGSEGEVFQCESMISHQSYNLVVNWLDEQSAAKH